MIRGRTSLGAATLLLALLSGAGGAVAAERSTLPDFSAALAAALAGEGRSPEAVGERESAFATSGMMTAAGLVQTPRGSIAVFALLPPRPRGTIILMHGYLSAADRFAPLARLFARSGWVVVAPDLPGHGDSYGPRYTVASFAEYGDCVGAVAAACSGELPRPLVGVGHSLGSLSLVDAIARHPGPNGGVDPGFDALLLVCPLTRSSWWPFVRASAFLTRPFFPIMPFTDIPVSWVDGLAAWRAAAPSLPPRPTRCLVVISALDMAVDVADSRRLLGTLLPEARFETIAGIGHWEIEKTEPSPRLASTLLDFLGGL